MDRETFKILSRIRDDPIVHDNPIQEMPPPEVMELVRLGFLHMECDKRNDEVFTIVVSKMGREALDSMKFPCWLRRSWKWMCGLAVLVATAIFHEAVGTFAHYAFDWLCSVFAP
ncbi:MAG: hypothetical protein IJQ73_03760 [Kiritimatiellae bacterium]|nr:hypothetical protein [Kiritimatiellia bacterium]